MDKTTKILGLIGSMQTLIENFPMSIFSINRGKRYDNSLEFVLDVLKQLGLDDITLTDKIIELFFGVPNAVEIYNNIGNYQYKLIKKPTENQIAEAILVDSIPNATYDSPNYICVNGVSYYYKSQPAISDELESTFLVGLEDGTKSVIMNILTAILSCSVVPEIPNLKMDVYANKDVTHSGTIEIPLSLIDTFNLMDVAPTSEIGKNFYSINDDLTPNTTYKATDLNAFLWYVINRGTKINQSEINKMVWDSRRVANEYDEYQRNEPELWNQWLQSKTAVTEDFAWNNSAVTLDTPLHPIIQFYPVNDGYTSEKHLKLSISSQSFYNKEGFNKSIYRFNKDYLDNIRIFSPRIILANMIDELLNGGLLGSLNIQYSIQQKFIEGRINEIIKKVLEEDDVTISDCFYSFSNEDYNNMLHDMELSRYNAKDLNSETSPAISIDSNIGLDSLNTINSMATMNEKLSTITKTVYDIAAIPAKDNAIEVSDKLSVGYSSKWVNEIVMALMKPLIKSILSPKVMLLFIINFDIMGLINLDDIHSFDDIMNLFYKKIMSAFISIAKYIKDKIIEYLLSLFFKYVEPLIIQFYIVLLTENLQYWLELLNEAMLCVKLFGFNRNVLTQIDDVNYADITQTQDIPEDSKTC